MTQNLDLELGPLKLMFGDCLDRLSELSDGSIDLILADLPYGTTACKWDSVIAFEPLWKHYERLIKPKGAIVLTASQPFTSALVMSNPKLFKVEWIWEKNMGSNFAAVKYQPMKEHESVLVFGSGAVTYNPIKLERNEAGKARQKYAHNPSNTGKRQAYNGLVESRPRPKHDEQLRCPRSVIKFNCERGLHPTQKPVKLFEYLIQTYSNPGELVLDNVAGSGTTGIAALNTDRRAILIEKDPDYYQLIAQRIRDHAQKKES